MLTSKFLGWALLSTAFPRDNTHMEAAYAGWNKCKDIVYQWLRENNMTGEDCERLSALLEANDYEWLKNLTKGEINDFPAS